MSICLAASLLVVASSAAADDPAEPEPQASSAAFDFFERRIRPVLVEHCYECHATSTKTVQGGLRLDTREGLLVGGDSGAVVVPGDADASLLVSALEYEDFQMPPMGPLPARIIKDFRRWIEMGAPDPRAGSGTGERHSGEKSTSEPDTELARQFWAFQDPARVPPATAALTASDEIDALVLERMSKSGLSPAASADRWSLVRRVYLDLVGLPPTLAESRRFVEDDSPAAYRRLVDRLLADPRHGEHRARAWMDVMRYAEDQAHIVGNNSQLFYPNAYLYRDWLIGALNEDLPYDEFIRRQLAADMLGETDPQKTAALGFLGLGPKYYRRNDPAVMADEWEDRIDVVGRGLLGLTLACARCHDHKFDPVPTEDYYALAGVFASTEMFNAPLASDAEVAEDGQAKEPANAVHIVRDSDATDLRVAVRGDVARPGALVPRRFVSVLSDEPVALDDGSGRLALAEAIASPQNPLTARVMVNRLWHQLIGRGLVATPSNFGALGRPPSHPQLLDNLAVQFMQDGWSMKRMQRRIVLSAVYRRSSVATAEQLAADPANELLLRMNRRRMTIEQWRDSLLLTSGQLDSTLGGPSVQPDDPSHGRRTLYSEISRLELNRFLAVFDHPDPNAHAPTRFVSTTPLQKLFMLNSPFMVAMAEESAQRLEAMRHARGSSGVDLATDAYQLLLGRAPTRQQRQAIDRFLEAAPDEDVLVTLAHALLCSNEMLFID